LKSTHVRARFDTWVGTKVLYLTSETGVETRDYYTLTFPSLFTTSTRIEWPEWMYTIHKAIFN
jgi:hypothetical protein